MSRQLTNGLFDPLSAFANWHLWLKPGGSIIVMDGLYDRAAWTDRWQEEVDVLPLSICQTMATVPYMIEKSGFEIVACELMSATNASPNTRTPRYIIVANRIPCTIVD